MTEDFPRKLGIKPGARIALLNPPKGFAPELEQVLPEDCALQQELPAEAVDLILMWPREEELSVELFRRLQRSITPSGAVWMVIPKKAGVKHVGYSVSWDVMVQAALQTDLVDNKDLTFDANTYGTRFAIRLAARPQSK